ncbi:MerR family transcriptional regulator [Paeniglutamicibacter terrestris]|uniref:MerR family transcriptional regulator n=1 Tax=Paeniglutamicibacter terrestris TaxID=2723403 RepID=A0ABX1GAQ3_9MICC|nr:MerR family transcriptional regulator [Paeniglutamicibacter terrestris]ASN40573.1 MerR family transcriptional regulator [Arthrobacter sp. 7749]NKG22661.1 MerR family transcriptional regulator [Paeniglutamicibacter terrestris]
MFSIGEFASIGQVSVRMLRHYDDIGLLPPARVDPHSGYRSYKGRQFAVLGAILAYKDLGFRLDEVARIVQGEVDDLALHTMLTSRRTELARQLDLDSARLGRLDMRLRHLEGAPLMSTITTELKPLPAQHVAQACAVVPGFGPENITPIIGPLFGRLARDLVAAGVRPGPRSLAMYEAIESGDGEGARAYAAFLVDADVEPGIGFAIADVPGAALAATTVHYGSMDTIGTSWEALHAWIEENNYELAGVCRELYIVSEPEPQENWVTELQQPVIRA